MQKGAENFSTLIFLNRYMDFLMLMIFKHNWKCFHPGID